MATCPSCGEDNPQRFRLCGFCGTLLQPETVPPREARKTVTILFCDLVGSTSLGEQMDSESLREVLDRYFAVMRGVIESHGGLVEKYIGDAIMALFGLPRAHEHDALRAVTAAHAMGTALEKLNAELQEGWGATLANRTGVNTGEVVVGEAASAQRLATGDAVNVAARLEQAAGRGEVLIGASTYRLVRDAVVVEPVAPVTAKGKTEPVPAFRLLRVLPRGVEVGRRPDAPLIGRQAELAVLEEAFARAVQERRCETVTVTGEAGVGKSRLLAEAATRRGEAATVLRGSCLSYGEGITFWPLATMLRAAAGIDDDDSPESARAKLRSLTPREQDSVPVTERLAALMGLTTDVFRLEESYWAVQRSFEVLASERPLMAIFEDLHWAEDALLDLLEYLTRSIEKVPVLVVCSARTDLLDARPGWMRDLPNARLVSLAPLAAEGVERLVRDLVGAELPSDAQSRIAAAAQGNPLFVEQIVSMWIDDGILRRSAGGWLFRGDPTSAPAIPPTISGLLAARLDGLPSEERAVLAPASVIGQVFYEGALSELCPAPLAERVPVALGALTAKRFVQPDPSSFVGEPAFAFRHALIKEAAYRATLKRSRAELHERFADWVEARAGDRMTELEEIVGYHLEQSFLLRRELGPVGDRMRALGVRAAGHLGSSGRRAMGRGDMRAAAGLLGRAEALLSGDVVTRAEILADLGEALRMSGRNPEALAVLEEAETLARAASDRRVEIKATLDRLNLEVDAGRTAPDDVEREARKALHALEGFGPSAESSHAWALIAAANLRRGRMDAMRSAMTTSVEHARHAGAPYTEAASRHGVLVATCLGPAPVEEVLAAARRDLTWAQSRGELRLEATALSVIARCEAMIVASSTVPGLVTDLERLDERVGRDAAAGEFWSEFAAEALLLAGELERAEARLRWMCETLTRAEVSDDVSLSLCWLGEVAYARGRSAEAEALAQRVEVMPILAGKESEIRWRKLLAKARGRRGEAAEDLAWAAVEIARSTDLTNLRADALHDLGEVLTFAGRASEAVGAFREAHALYERKGNRVSGAVVRKRLDELVGA